MTSYFSRTLRRLLAAALLGVGMAAGADTLYPDRPIKWLVGYPAGGGSDFLARTVGARLAEQLQQPVLIDNKPGAAGMIGADAAAKSPPDGYTIFTADNGILVYNPVLYKTIAYNPERDFVPIGLMARVPLILVAAPSARFSTLSSAIAAMKASPSRFSYASPGTGSPHHLAMELFKSQAGIFAVHIPYRGAAPAMQDVMGGQVPFMVVDMSTALQYIKSGKLVPLMAFSGKRVARLPDVPTALESGFREVEAYAWQGLVVPTGTPGPVRARLAKEVDAAISSTVVRHKLIDAGWEPNPGDPQLMAAYIAAEKAKWHKLIKERGIKVE